MKKARKETLVLEDHMPSTVANICKYLEKETSQTSITEKLADEFNLELLDYGYPLATS